MTSPLYSELPQELLLDVEPMRPARENQQKKSCASEKISKEEVHFFINLMFD